MIVTNQEIICELNDEVRCLLELVDGAYDIVYAWEPNTEGMKKWKQVWLEEAVRRGANPNP